MNKLLKEYISFFLSIIIFFVLPNLLVILFRPLLNITTNKYLVLSLFDLILSLIQTICIIIVYKKTYKEDFNKCKNTYKNSKVFGFIADVIIGFIIFMVIKVIASLFSTVIANLLGIKDLTTDNQSTIEALLGKYPIAMIISSTILAPITEETIFRRSIKGIIKNKKVFIAVSGLIFGMMHVIDSNIILFSILLIGIVISNIINSKESKNYKILLSIVSSIFILSITMICLLLYYNDINSILSIFDIKEMIGGITYVSVGCYLAYTYVKRDNIYYNIGIHAINNLFSVIILLFM